MSVITWSFGRTNFDNMPTNHRGDWNEFLSFLDSHKAKRKGLNYITSLMNGDGRRCKVNAHPRNWLVFDFDGEKVEIAPEKFDSLGVNDLLAKELVDFFSGLQSFMYQTASSAPGARKMRFIVQCDREIDDSESKALGALVTRMTVMPSGFDKCTFQAAQPVYLPLINEPILSFDGDVLPVDELLATIPPPPPKRFSHRRLNKSADAFDFFSKNGLILSDSAGGFDVVCPWAGVHSKADITGSVFFPPSADNNMAGGFKCHHSSCSHKTIADIYRLIEGLK